MSARLEAVLLATVGLALACAGPRRAVDAPLQAPVELRCEARSEPLGIGEPAPRLGWRLPPGEARGEPGVGAWEVRAASTRAGLAGGAADLWDSGAIAAGGAPGADWGGAPLASRTEVHWQVRARDAAGRASPWSAPARFTVGLLAAEDWSGTWIGAVDAGSAERTSSPWLRTTLVLPAPARRLVAHVASLGYHELWLDGAKCGDDVLMPSVTDLSQRARAVTHEVAGLAAGEHVLGLWLASGWAAHARYEVPAYPLVRADIEVELEDGRRLRFATGPDWEARPSSRAHLGPWAFGSYGGERVDAELEGGAWCAAGQKAKTETELAGWSPVRVYPVELPIVHEACEPTRRVQELVPVAVEERRPGVWRLDFGRAFTGHTRVAVHGPPRGSVRLRFSEREDEETTYGQESELVLDARGEGVFEHRFDYAAARWLTLEGATRAPGLGEARGYLVRTDYARTARFLCSDPLLQSLDETVAWTFECLSLGGYAVDCAHRERWGYGGDAHATMETALDHFGTGAFHSKWLADWRAIQDEHGNLPFTCPTYQGGGGPAWSGIVVMLPWEVWLRTGDRRLLERSWPTIERWLAFLETETRAGVLDFYFDARYEADVYSFLGDWVPPGGVQAGGPPSEEARFFNNAYRVWNVATAARIARVLGREEDARRLEGRAAELAAAVHARFFDPERRCYVSERQTYLALPVLAGLGDEALRAELFRRLCADVESRAHVDTGIHGTWMLTRLLLERGRPDLLALVASQRDFPSWGDMLAQGATTIWEQWDGVHSRMHSSFLSIGAFFVEGVAGIRALPEAPGYERFTLAPARIPGLEWAECELDTPRGRIRSAWFRRADGLVFECVVPPLSRASVRLPVPRGSRVSESGQELGRADGLARLRREGEELTFELAPGSYAFRVAPSSRPATPPP